MCASSLADPALPGPVRPRGRKRLRLLLYLLGLLLAAVAAVVGTYLYGQHQGTVALAAAIAEADHTDPRWRLEDIEADRAAVPDEENSALVVLAAGKLLPSGWNAAPVFENLAKVHPAAQLDPVQTAALRAELQRLGAAQAEGRKLANLPNGWDRLVYGQLFIATHLPHVQPAREMAELLGHDAMLRAQDGDVEGALASCRAALNSGRSLGDEPLLICQLVRLATREIALRQTERALAQGEAPEAALTALQKLLEQDAEHRPLLMAARGERAGQHQMLAYIEANSQVSLAALTRKGPQPTLRERFADLIPGNGVKAAHAWLLHYNTQAVEVLKLPEIEQKEAMAKLQASVQEGPAGVDSLVPKWDKVLACDRSRTAFLRCATVGLAAEHYRLRHKRWPEGLQTLVAAGLLKELPADPFGPGSLSFRRAADGIVLYSRGEQGSYGGDALDKKDFDPQASRLEFRLWDVRSRRRAPWAEAAPAPK